MLYVWLLSLTFLCLKERFETVAVKKSRGVKNYVKCMGHKTLCQGLSCPHFYV